MESASTRREERPQLVWSVRDVVRATGARTAVCDDVPCESVCTDSRHVPARALFVALRGPHHDGHRYAAEALRKGAAAVLVETVPPDVDTARALVVPDTLRALGDLAAWRRRDLRAPVIGITGSNGKTTTKEMVATICERLDPARGAAAVLKTVANENNLVGLPMTLLRLRGDEAAAVLEMGMNAFGEIARLAQIASPDAGVITNVAPAHLEGLGSIEGVARAKGELFAGMRPEATIAVNADDPWVVRVAAAFPGRKVEFGVTPARPLEVQANAVRDFGFDGVAFELGIAGRSATLRLRMPGLHNVANALAAAAVTHAVGVDLAAIAAGLEAALPPPMRMQVIRLANGVTVVNDGYNANPASMEAALRLIARQGGRSVAVLSEMRELGPDAALLHRRLGRLAAELGVRVVVAVGPHGEETARGAREGGVPAADVHVADDPARAASTVVGLWRAGDAILVKGSRGPDTEEAVRLRGSRMAEVVRLLAEAGGSRA